MDPDPGRRCDLIKIREYLRVISSHSSSRWLKASARIEHQPPCPTVNLSCIRIFKFSNSGFPQVNLKSSFVSTLYISKANKTLGEKNFCLEMYSPNNCYEQAE